jgi:hypothetical protein
MIIWGSSRCSPGARGRVRFRVMVRVRVTVRVRVRVNLKPNPNHNQSEESHSNQSKANQRQTILPSYEKKMHVTGSYVPRSHNYKVGNIGPGEHRYAPYCSMH